MLKSMTGYGRGIESYDNMEIVFEIKAVNNRFLDTNIRVPRSLSQFEEKIKKLISESVSRGKIDVFLTVNRSAGDTSKIELDEVVLDQYVTVLKRINELYGFEKPIDLNTVIRFPEIFNKKNIEDDEDKMWSRISDSAKLAISNFNEMRTIEGQNLFCDLDSKADELKEIINKIESLSPAAVQAYRDKLEAKLTDILSNEPLDESRVLTEVAIIADKLATDEERTRLYSHISQFKDIIRSDGPTGKKLDFLVQELNREVNTIGSKCQMLEISKLVIEAKCLIEKIREQIQNIE